MAMMRRILWAALLFGCVPLAVTRAGGPAHAGSPIRVSELANRPVIGLLGQPLGTIVTIEGVAADGGDRKGKKHAGQLLLRVQSVRGRRLAREQLIPFQPWTGVSLEALRAGGRFRFTGYETGGFSGVPAEAFRYVPAVATTGHVFTTSFVVLRDERRE